ncbi:MAG: CAP domain-containing protein [Parvibaculaceae bacterium]
MRPLRFPAILSMLLALAILGGCAASSGGSNEPVPLRGTGLPSEAAQQAQSDTPLGRAVLAAINAHRSAPPLIVDSTLQRAAAVHAQDMVIRNFRGHHNPEGQGPLDRVLALDPDFRGTVAENIWTGTALRGASDAETADYVLKGWRNSPRHRTTLESSAYTKTGIGVASKGNVIYIVQVFSD